VLAAVLDQPGETIARLANQQSARELARQDAEEG
jgi:hypothetical protein